MSNITYKEIVDYLKESTGDYNWYLNNKIGLPVAHRLMRPNLVQQHVTEAAKKLKKMKDEEHAGQLAHAARQSAKAGKTHFTMGGKTFPVTVKGEEHAGDFSHKAKKAAAAGQTSFEIGGKTYPVKANPNMKKEEVEQVDERHMTDKEKDYREYLVKKMKNKGWEKRYPGRGKEVMYATATKMAMKEEKKYIPKVGDHIATDIPFIHGKVTKVTPSLVHFKHPNGTEYTADHSAVGPVRKNKSMYEETINMYEDSAAERDHTHAAHFHDHKGNWSGMALITAKSDEDAIKKAHELAQSDRYKDFKLAHVEKHTAVKDLEESFVIESQDQLDEILSEDRAERAAADRAQAIKNIKAGKGSVASRKRLAARHGVHHITGEPLTHGGSDNAQSKHDDDDYYMHRGNKYTAAEVDKVKKSFKRRKLSTKSALDMLHNARKAASAKHATSGVGGGGTGARNVSPLDTAISRVKEKPAKGAGASPAELDAAKAEKKAAAKKPASAVKRLTGKLDEAKTKKEELNTDMIDGHEGGKKDKVKKVLQKALKKRKYLGMKKGRTATNEKAHKIEVDPTIEDAKT